MKIRTWQSNDWNNYKTNPGNGFAVPQYEKDEKTGLIKVKLDKDGKRVFHNLQDDIQKWKDTNSLERILSMNDGDLSALSFSTQNGFTDQDFTKVQNVEAVKDLQNKLASQGKTLDDLRIQLESALRKQQELLKKAQTPIKQDVKKGVENETQENKK